MKEVKSRPVRLKVGGVSAPALFFPVQQSFASSAEGIAASRKGAESQAYDTVSSADMPSPFPPSSDSGGGEGDVPARENQHILPPWERYLGGNEVTALHTRGRRKAQPTSARTWDGNRIETMAALTEIQNFGEALRTEAAGPGVTFEIWTEIEHEIQWGVCDDFVLAAESTPYPGESNNDFPSLIGMHIGHIENTLQSMVELRHSKYAEYWIRAMKSELEGHSTTGTF